MADLADAELLLPLTKFLTADKRAASNSTACQTTGTLAAILKDMTDTLFICAINDIKVDEDLGDGLEIIANEKNQNFPIVKLTNNKKVIQKFLTPELEKFIGLVEFNHLKSNTNLVAYSQSQFNEKETDSLTHLDLNLFLLKMYFFSLWTIKDNSVDFDLGFLHFINTKKEHQTSSNIFTGSNFTCNGNTQTVIFNTNELRKASLFLKENIIIENREVKTANSYTYGRITIANYFIQHARTCSDLGIKMTSYCSALETLFSNDSSELSHKLSERVAHFLSNDKDRRIYLFKLIKKAYEVRSRVVHGGTFKFQKIKELESLIIEVDEVCRQIIINSMSTPEKDNVFNWSVERHEEYFLDLIMK